MAIYAFSPANSTPSPSADTDPSAPPTPPSTDTAPTESSEPTAGIPDSASTEIELVGPLSAIYTKALNLTYVKDSSNTASQESSATDHLGQAATAIAANTVNEANFGINQPELYVYVTDADALTAETTPVVFDQLRVAMDVRPGKVKVVIESHGAVSRFQGLIESYLHAHQVPVYHTRQTAIQRLQEVLRG